MRLNQAQWLRDRFGSVSQSMFAEWEMPVLFLFQLEKLSSSLPRAQSCLEELKGLFL